MKRITWLTCVAVLLSVVLGLCPGAMAAGISGVLTSLGDTDSDSLYNYRLDYTVTNDDPSLAIDDVVIYFNDLRFSQIAFNTTPTDWVGISTTDPVAEGFGGLFVAGGADTWTGDTAGYNRIPAGSSMGGFSVFYEFTALDFFDSSLFFGEVGFDNSSNQTLIGLDLTFVPTSNPVPEPATLITLATGLAGLSYCKRRKR